MNIFYELLLSRAIQKILMLKISNFYQYITNTLYVTSGHSMDPTVKHDELLIVSPCITNPYNPHRGDIVVVGNRGDNRMLKRVIGLPCEYIKLSEGLLYINSVQISEYYLNGLPSSSSLSTFEWYLNHDEILVLGDNRSRSTDSRSFGPVKLNDILGKVLFRYWPLSRLRVLK